MGVSRTIKMITILVADNEEKVKEILSSLLDKKGNLNLDITRQENVVKIMKGEDIKGLVSLKDKIIELEDSLFEEKKGVLYKVILEAVEKPLLEHILRRTEGNQLKAAKILGINRNTFRAKVKKLGINPQVYKS